MKPIPTAADPRDAERRVPLILRPARPHPHERRPWGTYQVLAEDARHKVKRLCVRPRKRLSLQRHRFRSEHWIVLSGEALVTVEGEERRLAPGDSVDIPVGSWHRLANPGLQVLTLIEVQWGTYFGEDDIERSADDFGRAPHP